MSSASFAFLRRWDLGAPLQRLAANRRHDWLAVALANGAVALMPTDDAGEEPQIIAAHEGVSRALGRDADNHAFLSGGSDGALVILEPHQPFATPLLKLPGEEILETTATREGLRACATKRHIYLLNAEGEEIGAGLDLPDPPAALTFAPRGTFLSLAAEARLRLFDAYELHAPLRDVTLPAPIKRVLWKRDRSWIYALTTDDVLWGWPTDEKAGNFFEPLHFALPNEAAGASLLSLSAGDRFLIAGGASQAVAWPLKDGRPDSARPLILGEPGGRHITKIEPNPQDDLAAFGYDDGAVVLAPLDGRKEIVIFPPLEDKGARVIGLAWNPLGDCLHAALASGHVFLFTLKSVTAFIRSQQKV